MALRACAVNGTIGGMGIRYSAVAFDAHLSDIARDTPYRVYRRDPFDRLKRDWLSAYLRSQLARLA